MVYDWKDGSRIELDAQDAGEELERIAATEDGRLTAPVVVQAARKKSSPIHDHFEWNNTKAAEKHREAQARLLMRAIVVVIEEDDNEDYGGESLRAYVTITDVPEDDKPSETCYVSTRQAMADPTMREQILSRALKEAMQWQARYEHLEELAPIFAAIQDAASVAVA